MGAGACSSAARACRPRCAAAAERPGDAAPSARPRPARTWAPTAGPSPTAADASSTAARAKSATANWGPTVSVDTANSDMLMIIDLKMIVTVAGNLELYHASETAAATTVKAGTDVVVMKTL